MLYEIISKTPGSIKWRGCKRRIHKSIRTKGIFNGNNLTSGADSLEWNNKNWSIVNHFIPFTEQEVGASERFQSDFLVQFLSTVKFSEEATNVLKNGKVLWKSYFLHTNSRSIREKLKLNRADVGCYQIIKTI